MHNRVFATKTVSQTKQERWIKEGQQLERAGWGHGNLKHGSPDLTFGDVRLDSPMLKELKCRGLICVTAPVRV